MKATNELTRHSWVDGTLATYPSVALGDGVESVAGFQGPERVAHLLHHALDAVAVVDEGITARLV